MGENVTGTGHSKKGTLVKSEYLGGKSNSGLDNKKEQQRISNMVSSAESLLKLRFYPKLAKYNTGVK